jgi:Flp pilus assembly protein TadB
VQDTRALKSAKNLESWRAWEQQAQERSGFYAIAGVVMPLLMLVFVFACVLLKLAVSDAAAGFGVYLAAAFVLMAVAMLRLRAWKRANPWSPPA